MSKSDKKQDKLITIQAKLIHQSVSAWKVDCEGDIEWFPKAHCEFDEKKEEMTAPEWLLRDKFPDEDF